MNYLNHLNYHQLVKYQHELLELYFTVMSFAHLIHYQMIMDYLDYLIIYLEIFQKMDNFIVIIVKMEVNFITISQVKFKIKMVRYFKKLKDITIVHFTRVHFAIITNL